MAFTFNGTHSSNFFRVNSVKHSVLPPATARLLGVPGRPGAYDFGTDLGVREIEVEVTVVGSSATDLRSKVREIAAWLYHDEPKALVFDDEPDKTYKARIDGSTELDDLLTAGRGSLRFLCADPFAYGQTKQQEVGSVSGVVSTAPTFSRSSVAYKQDGSQVASGAPRYEGSSITVEEGTVNLLTANQADVETDLTGLTIYQAGGSPTLTRDTTKAWSGTASAKGTAATSGDLIVSTYVSRTAVTGGQKYTFSVRASASAAVSRSWQVVLTWYNTSGVEVGHSYGAVSTAVSAWTKLKVTGTAPPNAATVSCELRLLAAVAGESIWWDAAQLEAKDHATTWTVGTRAAEVLSFPTQDVLSAAEGTVEMVFSRIGTPTEWANLFAWGVWSSPVSSDLLAVSHNTGYGLNKIVAEVLDSAATTSTTLVLTLPGQTVAGRSYYVALRWRLDGTPNGYLTLDVYDREAGVWSSATINTDAAPTFAGQTQAYLGSDSAGTNQANALFDDLRVSSFARTDDQIRAAGEATTALPVDQGTTYKVGFDGSLNTTTQATEAVLSNFGTFKTFPKFTATFTSSAPSFKVSRGTDLVLVNRSFAPGDVLVIDHAKALVTVNGARVMPSVDLTSSFWSLERGSNTVTVDPPNVATVTVEWTERWL